MKQIVSKVWTKYPYPPLKTVQKIPRGFKNSSYLLTTKDGEKFVAKVYAQDFLSNKVISAYSNIIEKLHADGVPVLELIRGKDGEFLQTVRGENKTYQVTISKYVDAMPVSESYLNKKIVGEIALQLGKLHAKFRDVSVPKETQSPHQLGPALEVAFLVYPFE